MTCHTCERLRVEILGLAQQGLNSLTASVVPYSCISWAKPPNGLEEQDFNTAKIYLAVLNNDLFCQDCRNNIILTESVLTQIVSWVGLVALALH